MNKIYKLITLLFIIGFSNCSVAQHELRSTNKKAIKYFNEGKQYYDGRKNELAEIQLLKAIDKDPNFIDAEILLAYVYTEQGALKKAITHYERCIAIDYNYFPEVLPSAGVLQLKFGSYEAAKANFEKYLAISGPPLMMKSLAKDGLRDCNFAIEALKHPVDFNPINLGEAINSPLPEYFPSMTVDGNTFLYTRRLNSKMSYSGFNEDFYVSHKVGGKWSKSTNVRAINSTTNEGAPSLSANGMFLIFTSCSDPVEGYGSGRKGYGSCDLFYAFSAGDNWTKPKNLGKTINSRNWETQPSFSADGKTLYFIRGVGRGRERQQDIYMSTLSDQGAWATPKRLSNVINTKGAEESVYIHPDGVTLYFASDGHAGMGGLDIFMSKKDAQGNWTTPINLGYPINTFNDENSLLVAADGKLAYFASDREGGFGGLDLYQFEMPQDLKPEGVNYLAGKVYDANTKKPLGAKFQLIDLSTGEVMVESYSDQSNGKYLVSLPIDKDYALNVSSDNYLFYSENFTLTAGTALDPFLKNVPLQPIEVGESVVLKNVFFETAKFDLKSKSKIELDKLVEFLVKNSTLEIELGGHTDNVGNSKLNQTLSNNRAKAVYAYLVEKGIAKERLSTKGYGDTKPIASNDTEQGRAENRRTEFKVTKK